MDIYLRWATGDPDGKWERCTGTWLMHTQPVLHPLDPSYILDVHGDTWMPYYIKDKTYKRKKRMDGGLVAFNAGT